MMAESDETTEEARTGEATGDDAGQTDAARSTDDAGNQDDTGDAKLRKEASNYRRRLRDTEGRLKAVEAELRNLRVREIERVAEQRMADASDLWLRTSLDELVGEDGTVDFEKVAAAVDEALADKPHWASRRPRGDADQGTRGQAPAPVDFAGMLQQAAGGRRDR